jgi:fructose-1,6-bisphosphatase/inositol monophosphatase family enzyme
MGRKECTDLEGSAIASYAMKPKKFLMPLVDQWRDLLLPFKFFLPNGGPNGFADVAEGKVDVYFAPRQPYVDIYSGILVAERAETVVTDFDGNPVRCVDDVETVWDVVCSTNQTLHDKVLQAIADCRKKQEG